MSLKQRVYSVLVASAAGSFNTALSELLPEARFYPVLTVNSINEAKRAVNERSFDFILINSPLSDETGLSFAADAVSKKNAVVLLFVRSDIYADTLDTVAERGVFVLSKPTSRSAVTQDLEWMATTRERLRVQETKTQTLEDKMSEIRIINRAKLLLISEMHMDESQAHRYIEKQAMDRCISKRIVAEEIIRVYT